MSGNLADKVAVVTGGARGVGEAIVRRICAEGGSCVIADIDLRDAQIVANDIGPQALAVRVDVSVEVEVAAAVDEAQRVFGRLDVMINNAGIEGVLGSIEEIALSDWNHTLSVLLNSVFIGTKHAARVMTPRRTGIIINTASMAALRPGLAPHAYTTAKSAVVALTESSAAELYASGVRVVAVAPGAVVTRLIGSGDRNDLEATKKAKALESPFGRAPMPEDVAAVVAFLASEEAWLINATCIQLDAGVLAQRMRTPAAR